MRRFRSLLVVALLLTSSASAVGHPVPQMHHDRGVQVRLTEESVFVDYVLALDGWTLALDLMPFRKELGSPADAGAFYAAYARVYGPRLAQGFAATLDGKELAFEYVGHKLQIEDHLRYTFQFKAPLKSALTAGVHTFVLTDSNFALEPGTFKSAAKAEGGIKINETNVVAELENAPTITLQESDPQLDERQRTARVSFTVVSAAKAPITQPAESTEEPSDYRDGLWDVASSFDAHRLLATDLGLAMLLILAFFFGAAHALQPGHGKTLVAAYLVGQKGTILHAFFLGLVTTFTHTFVVILLAIVLPLVFPRAEAGVVFALSLGSGLIVVLLAVWLLLRRLGGQADHVHLFGGHHHHHRDGHHHHHLPTDGKVTVWALITLGVTGGLVPCVDALGLLAATVVLGKLWLGLPLILAFSAGLASVLVAVGVLVVKFKRFATSHWGEGRLVKSLPIVSAIATLILGLWMCQQALKQRDMLESAGPVSVSSREASDARR